MIPAPPMQFLKEIGKHKVIRHSIGSYVNGMVHTNTVESAFSLLKRGIVGNFHKASIKHLRRYLDEFSYRFNRRSEDDFIETVRRWQDSNHCPSKCSLRRRLRPLLRSLYIACLLRRFCQHPTENFVELFPCQLSCDGVLEATASGLSAMKLSRTLESAA
jgi:hypothetical protein